MAEKSSVFKETYAHYLDRIADVDLAAVAKRLGGEATDDGFCIPFFGRPYAVAPSGVTDPEGKRAPFDVCIVLFKSILMCPEVLPEAGEWTAFREFKDAAPLGGYFSANALNAMVKAFTGRLDALGRAAEIIGGRPPEESLTYDLALVFDALPRIPLLMLFNDAEEGFDARCSILFRKSTEVYLDMECVGILGAQLAGYLKAAAEG
ncbi:MAG: DUF3786 domain-containing protein [Desulfobacterales bacterium]|nr:DUF3786 domain-containing protein [Desulfobacterales bacterium]